MAVAPANDSAGEQPDRSEDGDPDNGDPGDSAADVPAPAGDGSGAGRADGDADTGAGDEADDEDEDDDKDRDADAAQDAEAEAEAEGPGEPEAGEPEEKEPEEEPGKDAAAGDAGDAEPEAEPEPGPEEPAKKPEQEPEEEEDTGKPEPARPGTGDRPTAVFTRRPATPAAPPKPATPPKPAVDQPTAMLGLPPATKDAPKAAPAAQPAAREHNERTAVLRPPVDQPTTHLRTPEPRDPLSLLAQLTNKPAPPPTPLRTFLRRVKIWTPLVVLLLVIVGVAQALRPLPEPSLELTAAASHTFDGETPAVPWPETGQAALDVEGLGTFGSAGEQEPVPIASVAKVMTAYILLRDHPMEEDGDGVEIPVDQLAEDEAGLSSEGESTVEVEAGTSLTQREALQAIMLASANNVARLVARWSAGSEEAFVAEMNETAAELGMTDTTYTDASGLTETTVSTARDQVILAHEAMRDPVFRQIVRMPSYEASNGETYQNWNWLVPLDGVVGIKTGTTTAAGGNLMFAAEQEVGGETQLIVGAVLSQPADAVENSILRGALNAGDALIQFAQEQLRAETLFQAGDVVGFVDDGLGGRTPVSVAEDVAVAGWAGLEVTVELEAPEDGVPGSAEAGTEVGTLTAGSTSVPVVLAGDLSEPALGDRLTRIA